MKIKTTYINITPHLKHLLIISAMYFLIGCGNNQDKGSSRSSGGLGLIHDPDEKYASEAYDSGSCEENALDFMKLEDKNIQAAFFHQLDSIKKVQFPNNDQDTTIYVDITPKILENFLMNLDKDQLAKTGEFEKEYNFNIAPPNFTYSKECKDRISITFDKNKCSFRLVIINQFFSEWCQESIVIYDFRILEDKITNFERYLVG